MAGEEALFQMAGGFMSTVFTLGIVAACLMGLFLIARKGIFARRPYTIILNRRRGGGVKREFHKGRYMKSKDKDEQFEISTGFMKSMIVARPPEDVINEGNVIECVSQGEDEVRWCRAGVSDLGIADIKPVLPEGARTAWGVVYKANYERKHQMNQLMQLAPSGMLVVGCIILAFVIWLGYQDVAKSNYSLAASNQAFANRLMSNATVVVHQQQAPAPSSSYVVQPPTQPPG